MNSGLKRTSTSAAVKPLGIFWDLDNCPIPLTTSASGVVEQIRQFIARRHPECSYTKEFVVVTNVKRLLDPIGNSIAYSLSSEVDISHISAVNAADDKLKRHISPFVDNYADKSLVLVMITGDINFAKDIQTALKKVFVIVFIFGDNCLQDLKNCVNESYSYANVINGVEEVAEQVSDDRRSVIKGLTTCIDNNVTQVIRDLVDSWNDSQLSGSFIGSVQRNTKQTDTELEEKINILVTAVSADASKALVRGAKQ